MIISDPVEFHDRTFMSHLKQLPWDDESFAKQFENVMNTGRYVKKIIKFYINFSFDYFFFSYMLFCRVSNKSVSVPQEIIKYPIFTEFHDTTEKTCPYYIYQDLLSIGTTKSNLNIFYISVLFLNHFFITKYLFKIY